MVWAASQRTVTHSVIMASQQDKKSHSPIPDPGHSYIGQRISSGNVSRVTNQFLSKPRLPEEYVFEYHLDEIVVLLRLTMIVGMTLLSLFTGLKILASEYCCVITGPG